MSDNRRGRMTRRGRANRERRAVYWCFHPPELVYRAQDGREVCGSCGSDEPGEVYIHAPPLILTLPRVGVPETPQARDRVRAALIRQGMPEDHAEAMTRAGWHGWISTLRG